MNSLKIFDSPEFGQVRTVTIDNEVFFVGKDVAEALGYKNTKDAIITHVSEEDRRILQRSEIATIENHMPKDVFPVNFISADIPNRGFTVINESGLYALIFGSKLDSAKRFKHWVTSEVLPTIRKTGTYTVPDMSKELQAIFVLDKRTVEMDKRMDRLEFDVPLYACESDELQKHLKKKVVNLLGGKKSNAYNDKSVRQKAFIDAYIQLKREFGDGLNSYKAIQRKYLELAHEFIEKYEPSTYLKDLILNTNSQLSWEEVKL